jgi:hypothetical protein
MSATVGEIQTINQYQVYRSLTQPVKSQATLRNRLYSPLSAKTDEPGSAEKLGITAVNTFQTTGQNNTRLLQLLSSTEQWLVASQNILNGKNATTQLSAAKSYATHKEAANEDTTSRPSTSGTSYYSEKAAETYLRGGLTFLSSSDNSSSNLNGAIYTGRTPESYFNGGLTYSLSSIYRSTTSNSSKTASLGQ